VGSNGVKKNSGVGRLTLPTLGPSKGGIGANEVNRLRVHAFYFRDGDKRNWGKKRNTG